MRTILPMLLASAFAAMASAQDAPAASHDGTWAVSGTTFEGRPLNAELVLTGYVGTWRLYARGATAAKNNPCLLKNFPVVVKTSTVDELTIHVDGRDLIPGCSEFTVTLKPAGNNALDGTTQRGSTIHIERK
jgi:hypothetical protein